MDGNEYEGAEIGRIAYILSKNEGYQDGTMMVDDDEYYFHNGSSKELDENKDYVNAADKKWSEFFLLHKNYYGYMLTILQKDGNRA